jgi:hypothetical protein
MATWVFTLTIDSTPYDLTPFVEIPSISRDRRLFTELRPNLNKCSFRCLYDATIFAALIAGTVADIAITKDGSAYFTGTLSPNYKAQIRDGRKMIELIAEDYTLSRMGETIRTPIAWAGYALCTPAAPTTSIVHAIAALAGVTVSASVPVLSTTIPYLVVTVDEKKTLAKLLEDILFDYSYVYRFTEAGELMLTIAVNTGTVTTTGTLTTAAGSANILGEPVIEKAPEKYDDIRVKYNLVEAKTGITLFEDKSGATATNPCEITLEATGDASGRDYYPMSNKIGEVFSAWSNPDGYKIWIATSAALDDEFETGITRDRALVNHYKKCCFGYVNGAGAAKKITKLKITGNAYIIAAQNTARASLSSAKLLFEYEAAHIFTDAAGQAQAKALAQYYAHSDLKITTKSKTAYTLGQYVLFADAIYAGISVKTRVIGIRDTTASRDVYEYALEAVADFSAISLVTEGASPKDPSALAAAAAASAETTAVAARSRTFATVALISAATGAYDNELAYCQQTASYWISGVAGTAFVDTGATTPSSSGLVAAWPLDEVPDIPDSAAGITYLQDQWLTVDGWRARADGSLSVASGIASLSSGNNYLNANPVKTIGGAKTIKVKARQTTGELAASLNVDYYDSTTLRSPIMSGGALSRDWKIFTYEASNITSLLNFWRANYNTVVGILEVDYIYVGTAAYTTPAVDGSGHGIYLCERRLHGTVNGATPYYSPRGRCLTFDGVNDYVSFDVTKFTHTGAFVFSVYVEGKARSAAQYLVSRDTGNAGGRGIRCWLSAANLPSFLISPDGTANVSLAADAGSECTANCELTFAYKPSTYMRIYKDGALIKETTSGVPALAFYSASQLFQLGALVGTLYFSGFLHSPILYSAELSDQDILSLGLGLRPSLPYRLVDWHLSNSASDGIITNSAEKPGYREDWLKLYNSAELITTTPSAVASMADGELKQLATEATTHGVWTPTTGGTAAKAYYDAVEALRVAYFNNGTRGTGGIGFALSKFSDDVKISAMSPTLEARLNTLIATGEALRAAIVAASKASAISTSAAAVPTNTPHYKGRYAYASRPTSGLIVDDTCTLYSTTAGERGIYKATNATTLAKQTAPTTEMIADAWADIMWIDNQVTDYGVPTDYTGTGVDFVDVLGANVAFMNKLFAQYVKIQTGGSIRGGDRYDEDGAVVDGTVPGFFISASGACKVAGIEFEGSQGGGVQWSGGVVVGTPLTISGLTIPRVCRMTATRIALIDGSDFLRCYSWSGSAFALVGNSLAVTIGDGTISRLSDTDVAITKASGSTTLQRYTFDGTNWTTVGNALSITVNGTPTAAAVDANTIILADNGASYPGTADLLRAYRYSAGNWSLVATYQTTDFCSDPAIAVLSPSLLAVNNAGNKIKMVAWSGSAFSLLATITITDTGSYRTACSLNGTDYVLISASTNNIMIYRWDGATLSLITDAMTPTISTGYKLGACALNGSDIIIVDGYNDTLRTIRFGFALSNTYIL